MSKDLKNVATETSFSPEKIEGERDDAMRWIGEGEFTSSIKMQAWPEACGYGNLDDVHDSDGDSIIVTSAPLFRVHGEALIEATLAQGTDPCYAARVLRKFADMLDGPRGHDIANMGLEEGDMDYAQRFEDGGVELINKAEYGKRWEEEQRKLGG